MNAPVARSRVGVAAMARTSVAVRPSLVLAALLTAATLVACGGSDAETESVADAPAVQPVSGAAAAGEAGKQLVSPSLDRSAPGGAQSEAAPGVAPSAPNGGATDAGGQPGSTEPSMPGVDFLGRTIIRTGAVELAVESVADAFERVSQIATGAGGFVAESRFYGRVPEDSPSDREPKPAESVARLPQGASLTLRIPADRFEDVVAQLRGVAVEVRSISTASQDVTGEVTDLESSLRNLRAVEARYVEMLDQARTIAEVLQVQDRLNQTRAQIDRAQGRLDAVQRMADMSTLTVTLIPAAAQAQPAEPSGALAPVREAWENSLEALRALGVGVLVAVAFGWWLLPLVAIVVWVLVRLARAYGRPPAAPAASIDTPQGTA